MGPNVLTTRSFQVVLTEMGLPIHPALLRAHTPKVMPSVVVTELLFSAWPQGEAICMLGHSSTSTCFQERQGCFAVRRAGSRSSTLNSH